MTAVSINQHAYLAWPGYFHRIAISDLHIVLDHVQFEKNSLVNRNKIRTKTGWCWLSVPVLTKGLFGRLEINRLEIVKNSPWEKKHWRSLVTNYSKAPYFEMYGGILQSAYQKGHHRLNELVKEITTGILDALDIRTPILFSSEMNARGKKDELVLNLCREAGATTYISGPFGRNYLDEERFRDNGIRVFYHDYAPPTYPQVFPGFESSLSIVDLLFNCGPESRHIMEKDQPLP